MDAVDTAAQPEKPVSDTWAARLGDVKERLVTTIGGRKPRDVIAEMLDAYERSQAVGGSELKEMQGITHHLSAVSSLVHSILVQAKDSEARTRDELLASREAEKNLRAEIQRLTVDVKSESDALKASLLDLEKRAAASESQLEKTESERLTLGQIVVRLQQQLEAQRSAIESQEANEKALRAKISEAEKILSDHRSAFQSLEHEKNSLAVEMEKAHLKIESLVLLTSDMATIKEDLKKAQLDAVESARELSLTEQRAAVYQVRISSLEDQLEGVRSHAAKSEQILMEQLESVRLHAAKSEQILQEQLESVRAQALKSEQILEAESKARKEAEKKLDLLRTSKEYLSHEEPMNRPLFPEHENIPNA